jgi:hypothetical protein
MRLEDTVRNIERDGNFGPDFILVARSIYLTNDRRARIKKMVNNRVGSSICDFKFHDDEAGVSKWLPMNDFLSSPPRFCLVPECPPMVSGVQ